MHRRTHTTALAGGAAIALFSLAGAVEAATMSAGLSAAAIAATSAPQASGQGKAGRRAARQRDYKGERRVQRAARADRGQQARRSAARGRQPVVVHRNINRTVNKTITRNVHKTIINQPHRDVHFDGRRFDGRRFDGRRFDGHHFDGHHFDSHRFHSRTSVNIGLSFGGGFGYGYSPYYSYGYHSYGYSPHYSYDYSPGYPYGYGSYVYAPDYSYQYNDYSSAPDSAYGAGAPAYSSGPAPTVVVIPPTETYASPTVSTADAWNLLVAGQYAAAQSAFAQDASAHPDDGRPKVGYALAAALRGDDDTAAWAFRRVFRLDPDGADRAPIDANLRQRIEALMYRYQDATGASDRAQAADAWFLVAATSYLLGDRAGADEAIRHASDLGDRSPEARNLASLVAHASR